MSNNIYNILNSFNKLTESTKPVEQAPKSKTLLESNMEQVLAEKYVGFKKVEKAAAAGGAENPAAVAAAVGRKKYGKEKFQKAAAAGKKMGEGQVTKTATGLTHKATDKYGAGEDTVDGKSHRNPDRLDKNAVKKLDASMGIKYKNRGTKGVEVEVDEKAPPGAKAERMVKDIKKSLSKDGKLTDKEKAIAYATTWKAHNAGKVEEMEAMLEGMFDGVDHTNIAANLGKLARVIKSVQTPEQFAVAQKYAQRMSGTIMKHQHDKMGFGSGMRANIGVSRDIQKDLAAKARELGIEYKALEEGWDDMLKDVEKKNKEKGTGKFDKKKISTGTVYTRKYDAKSGETDDDGKDGEGNEKAKRGRGRPKKTNESHATINKMVAGLFEGADPMLGTEEPQLSYEQDHLKQHLGNNLYAKLEKAMKLGDEIPDDLYDNLFEYYLDEMPYGTAKARTGDPMQWIQAKLQTVFPELAEARYGQQFAQMPSGQDIVPTQKPEGILSRAGRAVVGGIGKAAGAVNKAIGHGSDEELLGQLANKKTMDEELNELTRLAGMAESKKSPKADKDYDKDGEIESEKDEVIGSRRRAAGLDESKAKPDFLDVDKDGDKDEPMKKAVKDVEKVDECMGMVGTGGEQEGTMNISTNMSTDGTKNVTITASGSKADELAQMLKLAGMGNGAPEAQEEPAGVATVEVGANDETEAPEEYEATPSPSYDDEQEGEEEEVDEDSRYEASTTPEEEVMPTQALTKGGDGDVAGQEKKMNPTKPTWKNGDNAMSESISLKLMKEYESIKIKK